jgi:hypothetical protein
MTRIEGAFIAGLATLLVAGCATQAPATHPAGFVPPTNPRGGGESDPTIPLSQQQKDSRSASRGLLEQRAYVELDARMNAFQQAYRNGEVDDVELVREFGAFSTAEAALEEQFNDWIRVFPQSYAAHLSRGIYYFKCGVQTRGNKYLYRTTAAQISGMKLYLDKAKRDLEDSLSLDVKPIVTYRYLIKTEMEHGSAARNRQLLNKALALDTDSIIIRRPYMMALETRWGGSLAEMNAFLAASRDAGVSSKHLQLLSDMIEKERQWLNKNGPGGATANQDDSVD